MSQKSNTQNKRINKEKYSSSLSLGVLHVPGVRVRPEKRENSTGPLWRNSAPQKRNDFHSYHVRMRTRILRFDYPAEGAE